MMGKPEPQQKGLIPRSLEQIFQTSQSLQSQGWSYKMQVYLPWKIKSARFFFFLLIYILLYYPLLLFCRHLC